eukprot:188932-Pyramimonas_sp.AAC.1
MMPLHRAAPASSPFARERSGPCMAMPGPFGLVRETAKYSMLLAGTMFPMRGGSCLLGRLAVFNSSGGSSFASCDLLC